jgi:hypothetical protein
MGNYSTLTIVNTVQKGFYLSCANLSAHRIIGVWIEMWPEQEKIRELHNSHCKFLT